ncbi:hypothetical protein Bbelb_194810 [Branchiostoma belcheri]|nr:hypothetical protein Bbelb_194810 [Branchiostoma belcheri]
MCTVVEKVHEGCVAWLVAAVFGTEPSCPTTTSIGLCTCQIGGRSDGSSCTICTCKDAGETGVPYCLAPVDGSWSSWSSYSTCSVSCGLGLQTRTRTCSNPYPQYNGAVCDGSPTETVLCDTEVTCPDPLPANGGANLGKRTKANMAGYQANFTVRRPYSHVLFTYDCVDDNADCPARALSRECHLNSGYMLVNCRLSCGVCTANATDTCSTPPCHVTCTDSGDSLRYDCSCSGGWQGNLCNATVELTLEDVIDECASSPCTNGGVCLDRLNGYLCQCPPGYQGLHCETGYYSGYVPCITQFPGCPLLNPLSASLPVCKTKIGIAEGIHRNLAPMALEVPSSSGKITPIQNPGYGHFRVIIADLLSISDVDFVHQTWIRVVPMPLVTTLGPSLVTQHTSDDFWVSAEESWDPEGLVSSSDLKITWTCETSNGSCLRYVEAPGTCLKFSTDTKAYVDARATCQAEGARLVIVKTAEMDDFIRDNTPYWIGLDKLNGQSFTWSDGSSLTDGDFTNWGPSQPGFDLCVRFCYCPYTSMRYYSGIGWLPYTSYMYMWGSYPCSNPVHYICEKKDVCGKRLGYSSNQTAGTTFNFTAQASFPGRTSIQASQVVVFQDNRACVLAIRNISNFDWSNTKSSEELVLEAVPGTDDTPLYEWTVVEHPWGFGGFQMSSSEPQVVIASNTFNVEGTYTLRVVNYNGVCSDGLAVSEWTFTVWGLEPPAPRNKNMSTPCVIERAGAGGCVCCGDFADGPGYSNVTYKFIPRTTVDVEKGWVRFPQDEPILQTPLPLTPYSTQVPWYCPSIFPPQGFIMEVEVMTVDGRVAVLNVTEDIEETMDLGVLSQLQLDNVNGVIDFTSLLVMNTANLEKLSTNATLQIARGIELSGETIKMLVENDTDRTMAVDDINIASANIFTGSAILLKHVTTSTWDVEGSNINETIEANNKTASSAFNAIDNVLNMYDTLMPTDGTGSASLEMSMLHAKIQREPCQGGQKKVFTVNDTLFVLPAFNTLDNSCEDSFGVENGLEQKVSERSSSLTTAFSDANRREAKEYNFRRLASNVSTRLINSDFNPFRYSENSADVGSEVAGMTVWRGRDRRPLHSLPEPVDMIIPRDKQRTTSSVFKYTGQLRNSDDIIVVKFRPQRTRTALTILLNITSTSQPELDLPRVQLVWQRASQPTADSFEAAKWTAVLPVPQDQLYTLQLPHMYNNTNLTSNPYSWLLPTEALNVTEFDIQNKTTFYLGVKYAGEDTSVTVRVSILESACVYFGEDSSHLWEDDGCKVGPLSNTTHLHCRCDHLTKFAGFVPPNPIYFPPSGSINFNENPIGLIAVLTVFGLFLLGYLMARKADRLDLTKDNLDRVTPFTAVCRKLLPAGWVNVGVTTPTGQTLNPDPDCRYIITVYTGFRLDAGTTAQVSITVFGFRDESQPLALQDARRQLFQGGSVDSFLVSSEEPLGPLTHIHVWHDNTGPSPAWYLSKVVIQHLSSGQLDYFICNKWLALDEDDGRIDRMVFVASPEEMAAASNLISERAAKDFHDGHLWFSVVGRPARSGFTRAQRLACCMSTVYSTMLANIMFFGQGDNFDPPQPVRIMGVEIDPPISLPQIMIAIQSVIIVVPINALIVLLYRSAAPKASSKPVAKHADTKDVKAQDGQKGTGCRLPWWAATVAGLLVFTVSFVAAFFTVLYTLTFGREKAEVWFTAFITSFVTDLILIQPVKVLTLAAILGLLIRKPTTDDDPPPTEVAGDEEYLQEVAEQSAADVAATAPLAGETLTRDRAQRVRRKRCRHILREMVVYGLFLSVLMLMSYTERSNLAFHMNNSIRSALEGTFSTISDPASYWTWLEQDVLPAVHSPAWYNGRPCEENLTLSEHLTHAISPLQLRQVRITQEQDCTIPDAMAHIAASCLDEYSASKLDTGSHDGNWGVAANYTNHDNSTDNRTIPSPWDYTYGDINNGFLYVGEHGVYPSGGYIAALGRTLNDSLRTLTYLISNDWLDNRTRAVFTEAVLYNPHANLFAVVTMTTEFHITGRVSTATELVIFRIHHEGQVLLLVLRMGLIIFLLFSLVKEVLKFNTYGMVYLTDPWSWLEMLIITTGMAAMGLYARAQGMTDEVSGYLKEGHVLFHLYRAAAMWHQVYTYLLGALTCFTLVKFIRLLKFNKHVNALLYTMKKTAKPLVSFFVISGIVFTAFALAANLTLGIALSGYSSLLHTYTSLFNMMLGSFQFAILEESSPVWGPAIFLSFQRCVEWYTRSKPSQTGLKHDNQRLGKTSSPSWTRCMRC